MCDSAAHGRHVLSPQLFEHPHDSSCALKRVRGVAFAGSIPGSQGSVHIAPHVCVEGEIGVGSSVECGMGKTACMDSRVGGLQAGGCNRVLATANRQSMMGMRYVWLVLAPSICTSDYICNSVVGAA